MTFFVHSLLQRRDATLHRKRGQLLTTIRVTIWTLAVVRQIPTIDTRWRSIGRSTHTLRCTIRWHDVTAAYTLNTRVGMAMQKSGI